MSAPASGGHALVKDAASGFEKVVLVHPSAKASCEVCLQGATVTSWKIMGNELLYLSPKAIFAPGKAIRGGVPVVFPQFGPGVLPQHGFARNTLWTVGETSVLKASGDISQAFILEDSPATRAVYPHHFRLTLTVLLKPTALSMQLRIQNLNSDARPMSFTTLLHTYLRVDDINKTSVRGLKGRQYVDKVDGEKIKEETGDEIRFLEEIDRMYINGGAAPVSVRDGGNCELKLMTTGFSDYVVWNPSAGEKIKAMADMPDDGFETFVCVEAGSVCEPVTLEAGKEWTGVQGISLSLLPDTAAKVAEKQLAGSGKL